MKKNPIKWYQSIVGKQMLVFAVTLLPCIGFFFVIYWTFRTETISTVTEAALSRDNEIFDRVYSSINEIEFQIYGLFNEPELYIVSDLLDIYDAQRRVGKIKQLQDKKVWIEGYRRKI